MRRSVVTTMSGVSLVVVGLSLRASDVGPSHLAAAGRAPVGIVTGAAPAAGAPKAAAVPKHPSTRATASPSPSSARRATSPAVRPRTTTVVAPPKPSPKPSPKPAATYTVNGQPYQATDGYNGPYGPVQVQIVVRSRRIVQVNAIEYPQGSGRDQQINSYAIPQLDDEAMQAQSAQIDAVSGATCTSDGYIQSLQSAIDQAHSAGIF